jgi:two-component system NarL family sensor kinase
MDTKETTIYQAILMAAGIIGSIIIFLVISLIRQHRRRLRLYRSKVETEITTLENERTRIAADLHDELGPLLSAVKFKPSGIHPSLAEEEKLIDQSNIHIDAIILKMRQVANDLMPNILLRKGAVYAMDAFSNYITANFKLEIQFVAAGIPELPQDKAIHLYRIFQEIVHNTLKHAQAKKLNIRLFTEGNNLVLLTQDNGIGFNYENIAGESPGLGLHNMESRTEMLKGNMVITSKPGIGTQVHIKIPLH